MSARDWARDNPRAWSRGPLTVDDVLAAPRVCDPLGVRDCCLVTDGGGALVVVCRRAGPRAAPAAGARPAAAASAHGHRHISVDGRPDARTAAARVRRRAPSPRPGSGRPTWPARQLYDAFTITPILFLEDLGFCAKGEGGAFVAGRPRSRPGGALPVNTNGGGLSYGHPGCTGCSRWSRPSAGSREAGDEVVLAHGNGGVLSSQATVVLGAEATA